MNAERMRPQPGTPEFDQHQETMKRLYAELDAECFPTSGFTKVRTDQYGYSVYRIDGEDIYAR